MGIALLLVGAALLALGSNGQSPTQRTTTGRGGVFQDISGRLPQHFRPHHYNVELTPDIYREAPPFPFSGSVQIYFTCHVASNVVTINSKGLTINSSSIKLSLAPGQSGGDLSAPILRQWVQDDWWELLRFETTQPLIRNVSYILEMNFNGNMSNYVYGLYYTQYSSSDGNIKCIATTRFEAHGGRQAFPGFDEPDFKSTFNITVVRKPPAVSASNAPLLQTIDRGDGWVADVYDTTPKMSLFLVALAVGELQKLSAGRDNGYEVNIWARPEIIPKMNYLRSMAPKLQAWLANETGIPYREPKSDHFVVPNAYGFTANWGLLSYEEEDMVYIPETTRTSRKLNIASIQSYEISHLWYGDLVTCKWWDDNWLNEGFATYYQIRPTQAFGWEGSEMPQIQAQYFMEDDDQRNSSEPARKPIPTVWNAFDSFSTSTYLKGAAVVTMLEGILTTPPFKAGLTKYLLANEYDTVTTDDLWKALTEQAAIDGIKNPDGSPLDVKLRMDPWLNQMGFPIVSVTRNADGTATLVRSHFLRPPNQIINTPSPYNYTWDVPITIVSAESEPEAWDAAPSAWIDIDVNETTVSGFPTDVNKWALINTKFSMYYRVMYDNASQAAIVSQLLQNNTAIHVKSRCQIIDDAFSVARAGYFPEIAAMETTRYLANETKWGPWNAALRHLEYSRRLIRKQSWSELHRCYVLSLTAPVYERLGWTYAETETPLQQYLRSDIIYIGCAYGHADCLTEARSQYALIVANPSANVVDPNNLPTVLCVGVREGTEDDWQLSFDQYLSRKTSQIIEERWVYLCACACTTDTKLLDRLLQMLSSSVAPRDRNSLAQCLSQSDYGAQILWNYLDINWNNLSDTSAVFLIPGLNRMTQLTNVAPGFTTQAELDKLHAFKARHPPSNGAETTSYTNLILDVENNINWLNREGPDLQQWLKDHQPSESIIRTSNLETYGLPVPRKQHLQAVRGG